MTARPQVSAPQWRSDTYEAIPQPSRSGSLRLLHVEDNSADALLAQSYIRGVIPDVVFDTAERISDVTAEIAAAASCAILDLSLPDASGLEALHVLRGLSAELPIIVLTGFDDLQVGLSAIRDGAEDYLVKNFVDGDSLQRAIRYAMERRRLSVELATRPAPMATPVLVAPPVLVSTAAPGRHEQAANGRDIHQVTITVNPETGVFSLHCQTCTWQATGSPESMSSWGSLERALLPHVAFGGNIASSPVQD
jgi:CheY-like chemotaxis protein